MLNQKGEALKRMKILGLQENVIKEFENENKLNKSELIGFLYWLNEEETKMIKEWEQNTGNLAYHVRLDNTNFGQLYSIFYVSKNEEEWELDVNDLANNMSLVYVINRTNDLMSEYGSISFKKNIGGIVRAS